MVFRLRLDFDDLGSILKVKVSHFGNLTHCKQLSFVSAVSEPTRPLLSS